MRELTPVLLRPLRDEDAPTLASWSEDEIFRQCAGWSADLPIEKHVQFWRTMASAPPPELLRVAAIVGNELVGYVDLHGTEPDRRELGFLVGPSTRWGRGLGLRVAAKGVALGLVELGLPEVWAETHPRNAAALAILRKLGMTEFGEGDEEEFLGERERMRQFSLTRDRWFGHVEPGANSSTGG